MGQTPDRRSRLNAGAPKGLNSAASAPAGLQRCATGGSLSHPSSCGLRYMGLQRFGELEDSGMLRSLVPLAGALVIAACGGETGDTADAAPAAHNEAAAPAAEPSASSPSATAGASGSQADEAASGDAAAILASLGGDYANADLTNGARQFRRCQSCHTLNEGGRHTVGPNLHGIMGRAAASAEGFSYSRQLTEAGLTWDVETLDAWIENPRAMVPGNRMSFVGLRDAADRRDVIGYLAVETAD